MQKKGNYSVKDSGNVRKGPNVLFENMGQLPSIKILINILQKCGKEKDLASAKLLHAHICSYGLEAHRALGNYIVPMFVDCGSMPHAQHVFNRLVHPNVHAWTSLFSGYTQCGQSQHALNLYQKMQFSGCCPSKFTLIALLKACARLKNVDRGQAIHVETMQKGFDADPFVGSCLIYMYAKCGSLSEARVVFDKLPVRDVIPWTTLIAGYAENRLGQEALKCFEEMHIDGIVPTAVTFACILKACSSVGAIDKGREIHKKVLQMGLEGNLFVGSSLVNMYAKCGALSEAQEIFDKLPVRNIVSWNALIAGYVENGQSQEVFKIFKQMQLEDISADAATYLCILKACRSMGAIEKGREIHVEIMQKKLELNLFVGNTLVDMYAKCGSFEEAWEVFDKLPVRDVVSWNAIIAGYTEHGCGQEALECFEQMKLEGSLPDAITFVCILQACGSIGLIDNGRDIHVEITQRKLNIHPLVGNGLIDMYAKCGSLSEAREAFDNLLVPSAVSWSSLIAGYAEHGPGEEALNCFEQMQQQGSSPDTVTFTCILKACGKIGDIEKGREIHSQIVQKGFQKDPFVGSALIDMYAKCDSLSEADRVFHKLSVRDIVSWTALIGGYADHGHSHGALELFEKMQLEGVSPNVVTFVCMLKVCSRIGAIEKAQEIHTNIIQSGFERDIFIGNSLIDMYAKCGLLLEARKVFDNLPVQGVVSWNAMINGYGMNNEGMFAAQCFKVMKERGVQPNAITFKCLLTACSHSSLVFLGQEYFKAMKEEYCIIPTLDHFTCMIDLLARSGHLYEAEKVLESMPYNQSIEMWTALLSACKTYGEAVLGLKCFRQLIQMDPKNSAAYALMEDIYASIGREDNAHRVEERRKDAGAKKKPAAALIEVNKKVYEFVVGNNDNEEISAMLEFLDLRMKEEAYMPNIGIFLKPISDDEKEVAICEHAEKLAIAFGLLNTPRGQTLHVFKNMRMCRNCHDVNKIISMVERRNIMVKDGYCLHHFKNGFCSCTVGM